MGERKKDGWIARALTPVMGVICALMLGGLFYGVMVYQAGEQPTREAIQEVPAIPPLEQGARAEQMLPGGLLTLEEYGAQLLEEHISDEMTGGERCRVVSRRYLLPDGMHALAVSAYPSAYMERMITEQYTPQLVTGYVIGELEALCAEGNGQRMLAAGDGQKVYMIMTDAREEQLYELGASGRIR